MGGEAGGGDEAGAARLATALQSESKLERRRALEDLRRELQRPEADLVNAFPGVYGHVLKGFSDEAEACREVAAGIVEEFVERLPLNDYYLTYILPALVRRIGQPEIVEPSEELRLMLVQLLHKIISKYSSTTLLSAFFNDFTCILTKTSTDPFPKVKIEACGCIILLTEVLKRDFHMQSESFVKPVLSNFSHQHFRVRVAAIKCIGATVMAGAAKCFEQSITPMAEKLFDENQSVRAQVTLEVGNWMLNLRDRYSFWHRMIPLLLTSMSDAIEDIRESASKLWSDVGLQFMEENDQDLKKQSDFLTDVPDHYPQYATRPNLGCRVLVQRNIGKIVPAIAREMDGWQEDARLRVAQLLCWLLLCAEEGATQHANTVVGTLHRGARDDDKRVVAEVQRAAEIFGYFITPDTWWPLVQPLLDSWGALFVLAAIIKGTNPKELRSTKFLKEICKELSEPGRCQTRKEKYQRNMLRVADALLMLLGESCREVGEELFFVSFTVLAMAEENLQFHALGVLDKQRQAEGVGRSLPLLYQRYLKGVLAAVTSDALSWNKLSPEVALLHTALTNGGNALGVNLHLLAPLLTESLGEPQVDPEVKLKLFVALSACLLSKHINFRLAENEKLEAFFKIVLQGVIMPSLVWAPGRTAEAIRCAAVGCLCSLLQEEPDADQQCPLVNSQADIDSQKQPVIIFSTKEALEPFLLDGTPLLTGLVDDNCAETREHALRAISTVAKVASGLGCFTPELLHKVYFVVLKRLDDSNNRVRSFAVQAICKLFQSRPADYDLVTFNAHVDAVYSAMLIHLDDTDEGFRKEMLDALLSISDVDPKLLLKKVKANSHLYRNREAFNKLEQHVVACLSQN